MSLTKRTRQPSTTKTNAALAVRSQKASAKPQLATLDPLTFPVDTEIVGIVLELAPQTTAKLNPQYTTRLHAWFLDQVRRYNPDLSAYLHDGESEKPFTISGLHGALVSRGKEWEITAGETYRWYVTVLSRPVVEWLANWLQAPPPEIVLETATLPIEAIAISHPPTTYTELFTADRPNPPTITLSFLTPTSFRRKKHHFPLPTPVNVFHSYLRRWNDFAGNKFDQEDFLAWIDEGAIIHHHRLESVKVTAGKKGSVTGFTGAIEYGLSSSAQKHTEYQQLFYALGRLAPYCGTGHKTTFGLGQTRWGWQISEDIASPPSIQTVLAQRIAELTEIFIAQRRRTGGDRAHQIAEIWATILARREMGESLQAIATDLEMPYETVKTYAKLSRRALKSE
ncbi:CRISPR-associated protein, Cas6 family [Crinalium epipsammum PCC 9333]|uniref:CRISPR-associated protein, Cas6 family n=1 Tax=Crinalium epipsammum PCC 9333 TaxID=1173022 RepID=K9VUC0_9CYAN|nr:CRISPR-associated endoribonuclease Cas6 [Crinalium epipsammum]AFZ11531.1 CRISPR-associated protein, Cas6 family [Crinalium epipsammum PCC 9333]